MRVTIADVARTAAVSKTTVSRVLNGKGEVDRTTAERVRGVIDELGYVPSSRAVSLARGNSRTLAILVPSLGWPWISQILQGVSDTVESAGYGLLLFTCNRGEQSMAQFTSQVTARAFDGLLAIVPGDALPTLEKLHAQGLPAVVIDDQGQRPRLPFVATTNAEGGAAAARHLLDTGRVRPLVVAGPPRFGCVQDRLTGFRAALRERNLPKPGALVVGSDFTVSSGRRAVEGVLAEGRPFDSVFALNDQTAVGALAALRAAGRSVPDDVAVIGFDDVPMASVSDPQLTTIRQPIRRMGETAAQMLLHHLQGAPLPAEPVVLPTELVVRASAPN
ncbi:LacI family DNA-binding transcriptional regulator [Streptomyces bohaiensis]|uniref:LacI family transcriptional regulator n=1 Tax=Streptomyces bohaiensis TaxID=1431344 RepID=A0ABX1CJJ3_9ACTN|nr:LacI family DNA-binding transcriptional regulator [Streptomyces bohaiensis]NJQ17454.1 LacI family transcriptional regulator [Streptomyces bohaiensis]